MNALFKKSQEIVNWMNKLEIQKYHEYSATDTAADNFLTLAGISITFSLLNTYLGNDLNQFLSRLLLKLWKNFRIILKIFILYLLKSTDYILASVFFIPIYKKNPFRFFSAV